MAWIAAGSDRTAVMSVLPPIAQKFAALYADLRAQPHIDNGTLELCRLRLAQLHRSRVDWQRQECEVGQDKREQLAAWSGSEAFSGPERACLEFTEVYAMDPQSISDRQADAVKAHYGDAGLVALVEALGIFDGMARLSLLWQLPDNPAA